MSFFQRVLKRSFDIAFSALGLFVLWPLILIAALVARSDTGGSGIFSQSRIGRNGKPFLVRKIRTMTVKDLGLTSTVTTAGDPRITRSGRFMRKTKIDELPQLYNVLVGDMSFVGPRPDVREFTDLLSGDELEVLQCRPGITGPATLKYRDEEALLAAQEDPELYNKSVVWPDKVRINLEYLRDYSFVRDIRYILQTLSRRDA